MMGSWWLIWMVFILVFVFSPIGYGWGYRRWGPPYPRYVQRRRSERATALDASTSFNHQSWGVGGDFIWTMLLVAVVWAVAAYWWI